MAVSLSTIAAKDSAGTAIAGGLQAQDKSGAGTGPFTLGQVLIDGLAGINMVAVTAANALKVDGSAVTQPVSAASLPLPTGAATAAKQPALGTAGTAASDVISVQGIASMTPLLATATLNAETTKVIGVVRTADGSGNLLTSTGNALDINIKSGALAPTSTQKAFSVVGSPAAVAIKASAGTLYGYQAVNTGAAPVYLKFYNVAAGSVTVGTTVPVYTIPIPTVATTGAGIAPALPAAGIAFSTAMSFAFTNAAADNDATAVAVGTTLNIQFI